MCEGKIVAPCQPRSRLDVLADRHVSNPLKLLQQCRERAVEAGMLGARWSMPVRAVLPWPPLSGCRVVRWKEGCQQVEGKTKASDDGRW